jgi:hypothetical protein
VEGGTSVVKGWALHVPGACLQVPRAGTWVKSLLECWVGAVVVIAQPERHGCGGYSVAEGVRSQAAESVEVSTPCSKASGSLDALR